MRRLFVLLGSIVVLFLIAALAIPPFVDWDQFRDKFEIEASRILGQPVTVKGATSARLLPLPSVTFKNIRVGDREDGIPMLVAESFHMDVELAPLLKGEVVIVDMQLQKPQANFHVNRDGTLDWTQRDPDLPGSIAVRDVLFEKVAITDGALRVRDDRYKREFIIKDIDVDASARTLVGPWRVNGFATYLDEQVRVAITTGRWQSENGLRVKLAAEAKSYPYDFEIDGPLKIEKGEPKFSGLFKLKPASRQTEKDKVVFARSAEKAALPVYANGQIDITSSGAKIPEYKLDVGKRDDPYKLSGKADVVFGDEVSFKVWANGQQINIERLISKADKSGSKDLSAVDRLRAVQKVLERVPRFAADGEVVLSLPAIVAGDTVIRDVSVNVRPKTGGRSWRVRDLKAQLPGRTNLLADGTIKLGNSFGYDGELIVASKQPSGFAKWLGSPVPPAIRDLASAGFSAKAIITAEEADFKELEVLLGGNSLTGDLNRLAAKNGQRPKLKSTLSGDNVNFDQLTSLFDLFSGGRETGTTLGDHDIVLDMQAKKLSFLDVDATDVVADLAFENDRASINKLEIADIAGARISVKGNVADFSSEPLGNLEGSMTAKNVGPALALLKKKLGALPLLKPILKRAVHYKDTDLSFAFDAHEQSGSSLTVEGKTGGSDAYLFVRASPGDNSFYNKNLQAKFILVNDGPAPLLGQLGVPVTALDVAGRAAFRIEIVGVPAKGLKTNGAITAQDAFVSFGGNLIAQMSGDGLDLNGLLNLKAEAEDFDPWIMLSGLPFPGFGNGISGRLDSRMILDAGRYKLEQMVATVGDTRVTGDLTLDTKIAPRPFVAGRLTVAETDLSLLGDTVFVESEGQASPLFSGLDGKIKLLVPQATLPQFPSYPATSLSTDVVIADGDVGLEDIKADWAGGVISGNVALGQTNSARLISGDFEIKDADVGQFSGLIGFNDVFAGRMDVSATFESSARGGKKLMSGITGSGVAQIRAGVINGLNSGGLANLLVAADRISDEKVAQSTGELVRASVYGKAISFDEANVAFSMASGQLRANNITFGDDKLRASANVRADLVTNKVSADAQLSYQPGKQAVVGANPEITVSFSGEPGSMKRTEEVALLSTYLGLRVSERREREFEAQQAAILERQRLLRTSRYYTLKEEAKRLARVEQERIEQLKAAEEERKRIEEFRRKREEEEQARLEEAIRKAEDAAVREAAEEAGRRERRSEELDRLRRRSEEGKALSERLEKFREQLRLDNASGG